MTRIKNVKVGDPMGFKVNITTEVVLNSLVDALKTYHGGKYIIGKDTKFVEKPHYHIHWFSVKEVTEGALKTFRSTLKKKLTWLDKGDKLYTGQDTESADKDRWIAYAIKEETIDVVGIEVTEEIKVLSKASLENKRQNKVYSEKKKVEEKEKKQFKDKMFEYIKIHISNFNDINDENYCNEKRAFDIACIDFLIKEEKYGSMKKIFLGQYYLEWKIKHSIQKWTSIEILTYLDNK